MSSPCSSSASWACASAKSLCRSMAERPAASTIMPSDCRTLLVLAAFSCVKDDGLFCISRSSTAVARVSESRTSISSFSLAMKSRASFLRITVASCSSFVLVAIATARSSILESDASMALLSLLILASSFPFCIVPVLISNFAFWEEPSHQSRNCLYAVSSASPSLVILAWRSVRRSMTFPSGFSAALPATATNMGDAKVTKSTARVLKVCIAAGGRAKTDSSRDK
mmetsp:Transcript_22844/g.63612  ORF Transcript_22844/g.63612 Transcript_22844/m.63612 type:complete len:226 (+) Transcript_22844:575-1252(+)